ncbi:MAG: thioredoxin domain-containing protein [Clostridiales bacterium]|nr:thioredoxin domain-containing protein [Clostridiales bacterium]
MSNHLIRETSPYLLQHAENPVDWYPWCEEAFRRAKAEDKPVFLSIGYSTCHWCHVMAHESFEDEDIAGLLNRHFISIKVDKEERPDIDSVYMAVCQAFTGSGGWPTSIFMTPEQKPFFAGTYFPKSSRGGMIGLRELLSLIHEKWIADRAALQSQADSLVTDLSREPGRAAMADERLPDIAAAHYEHLYDRKNGGFGRAPKFPTPHNLLFLLAYYQRRGSAACLEMAEHTLAQMYRGGLFDHIGGGFCRYSTDSRFLVPHFEKMLYDNALLIMAYCKAYELTRKSLYLDVAKKTADYILREMTSPEGGFYSAQDADSDGEEGKYYLFTPGELSSVLGDREGAALGAHFGFSPAGNFEGKNIPNLLSSDPGNKAFEPLLPRLAQYRRERCRLHLDDKILTMWSGLMVAAMCRLYRCCGSTAYLEAARRADEFIRRNLWEGDTLFVSFRAGKRGIKGLLDDYAACIFAQLELYGAALEPVYLDRAETLCGKVLEQFRAGDGGFYLYSRESEALILRPKETYDGAIPSGNSLMAYNFARLSLLRPGAGYEGEAERLLDFLSPEAAQYPAGHGMFLTALLEYREPPAKITAVAAEQTDIEKLPLLLPSDAALILLPRPTEEYPLKDGKTTYYVCRSHRCLPPVNELSEAYS